MNKLNHRYLLSVILLMLSAVVLAQPDLNMNTDTPFQFPGDGQAHIVEFNVNNDGDLIAGDGILIDIQLQDPLLDFEGTITGDPNWDCSNLQNLNTCLYQGPLNAFGGTTTLGVGIIHQPGDFTYMPAIVATVSDVGGVEVNTSDNTALIDIQFLGGSVDLEITKSITPGFPNNVNPGDQINFNLNVSNALGPDANNVIITDDIIVNNLIFEPGGSSPECVDTGSVIQCTVLSLPTGDALDFTIATTVDINAQPGPKTNVADVSADEVDPFPSNNSDTVGFVVLAGPPSADLDLTLIPNQTTYTVGDLVTLDLTLHNPFASTAAPTNNTVVTTLPNEVVFNSAQVTNAAGWACTHDGSPTGGDVTCDSQGNPVPIGTNTFIEVVAVATTAGTTLGASAIVTSDFDPNPSNDVANGFFDIFPGDADLSLVFTSSGSTYNQGDSIFYGIQVNNPMGSTASPSDTTVSINLPTEVSFTNVNLANAPGWFCNHDGSPNGGDISCDRAGAPFVSFSTHDFSVEVLAVTPTGTGAFANADIFSAADSFTSNNSDGQVDTINAGSADFSVVKTVSGTNFAVNDTFTYFLAVSNPAPSTASPVDVVITDQLPPEVSFDSFVTASVNGTPVSCTHDGSATGGLVSCDTGGAPFQIAEDVTIDINVTAATASPNVNNAATVVTVADPDGNTGNNTDSAPTVVITGPTVTTVTATKRASVAGVPITTVNYGQNFEYVLEVQNTGPNDALNIQVTDNLPIDVSLNNTTATGWTCTMIMIQRGGGDIVDCTLDNPLPSGATAQIVLDVTATSNTAVTSIFNQMQVIGTNIGPAVNDSITLSLLNAMGALNLSQVPSPVDPGADVDFVVLASNMGTATLTGVQIDSQIPTGFTYNGFSGDPGVSCAENSGLVSCIYTPPLAASGNVNVTIQTTSVANPVPNQTYALNTTFDALELSTPLSESLPVAFSTSDVFVSIISTTPEVEVGTPYTEIISINNTGSFDIVNVSAFYAVPEQANLLGVSSNDYSCTFDNPIITCNNISTLLQGESSSIDVRLQVDDFIGPVDSNVAVNADGVLKTAYNRVVVLGNAANDLSLTKTASVNEVGTNEPLTYLLDVLNVGSETQTSFILTDNLPEGMVLQGYSGSGWVCEGNTSVTCQFNGSLTSGNHTQLSLNVIAPDTTGQFTNNAAVSLPGDENPSNDSDSAPVNVVNGTGGVARADLAVTVEANNSTVINTEQVSWTIEVSNMGPNAAENVEIINQLPVGFIPGNVQVGAGVSCTLLDTSLMCEIAALPNNQSQQILLDGTFVAGFSGVIFNDVEVTADTFDPDPSNNQGSGQITVNTVADLDADLALELNVSQQQVQQGDSVELSFIALNNGPDRAVNARLNASISGLIQNVQLVSADGWACQVNNTAVNCTYPSDFQVGDMSTINLRVNTQQVVQQSQPIVLNASIESDSMDTQPGNNMVSFNNDVTRTPTEEEIFAIFDGVVGSSASDTVMQTIRNVSSYCARSYFMAIEGLCEELIAGARPENGGDIINLMEEITPNEVAGQSNSAAEIITSQYRNVDSRLAQLKGGGGAGFNVSGLTGRYGNESIPIGMLAYLNESEEDPATSNISDFVSPWGVFVNGSISMGERDTTGRELGFDFDTFGLTAGVDYRFSPTKVAGLALGYANFDSEIEGEAEMKSTGFTLTGYGSFYLKDNLYLDGRVSYGNPDFEQNRRINFNLDNIAVDRVATGKTDSDQYSVAMSMGYHFNKNAWNITPNASFRYVKTTIDAFQETGAGGFNFAFAEQEVKSMVWSVGASVSKAISLKNGVLAPQFDFNFSRETENDGGFVEARFIDAPDDEIFFIATDEPDRTYGSAGVGLVFIGANGKQAYINYRSIFGLEGFTRGTINIGARFEF